MSATASAFHVLSQSRDFELSSHRNVLQHILPNAIKANGQQPARSTMPVEEQVPALVGEGTKNFNGSMHGDEGAFNGVARPSQQSQTLHQKLINAEFAAMPDETEITGDHSERNYPRHY